MQPRREFTVGKGQLKAIKGKQNCFLLFPFISFYFLLFPGIGTFQWVTPKEIKKSFSARNSPVRLCANGHKRGPSGNDNGARSSEGLIAVSLSTLPRSAAGATPPVGSFRFNRNYTKALRNRQAFFPQPG